MKNLRIALRTLALGLAVGIGIGGTACGGSGDHPGHGTIRDVDPAARTVTLEHGDIPGVMKAMTMTFPVAPEVPLDGIAAGTEVDFRLRQDGTRYIVSGIQASDS